MVVSQHRVISDGSGYLGLTPTRLQVWGRGCPDHLFCLGIGGTKLSVDEGSEKEAGFRLNIEEQKIMTTNDLHKGTYVLAGPTAPPLPLQTSSPSCLGEDDDYDDGGFITAKVAEYQEVPPPVKEREDMDKQNVLSTAESTQRKDQRRLHVFILYVLMAICFAMWAGLLSVFLIKYSAMSEELQALNLNYSEMLMRAWKDLDNSQESQKIMERTVSNNFSELQDFTPSICGEGNFPFSRPCPINWKMEGRNCYYFSTKSENWTDALSHCINQKADLVSILSDEEQGFVMHNLNDLTHWLGMTDAEKEGKWRWTEGNLPVATAFWGRGEPGIGYKKNCGVIHSSGTWSSAMCSFRYPWICKKKLIC